MCDVSGWVEMRNYLKDKKEIIKSDNRLFTPNHVLSLYYGRDIDVNSNQYSITIWGLLDFMYVRNCKISLVDFHSFGI